MIINKNNLVISKVCDGSKRIELSALHFGKTYTEACDQFMLIRVEKIDIEEEELPPKEGEKNIDPVDVMINGQEAGKLKFFKKNKTVPILDNVIISPSGSKGNKTLALVTTDLSSKNIVHARQISGKYPDTESLIFEKIEEPDGFSLSLLKKLITTLCSMDIEDTAKIKLINRDQIQIEGETKQEQKVKAILKLHYK